MAGTQRKREALSAAADMPAYMRKDGHGYRFLRPIPKDLVQRFGKANFVKRLGKDYKQAKALCAELTVLTDRELAAARVACMESASLESYLKLPLAKRFKKIPYSPELAGQLASLWLNSLEVDAQARQAGLEDDEYNALQDNINQMLPRLKHALGSGQVSAFYPAINDLLVGRGYLLEANKEEWQKLTYEVLKHTRFGYQILAARQQGEMLNEPDMSALPAPLPAVWEAFGNAEAKHLPRRLDDITPHYQEHIKSVSAKSQSAYLSIWSRFVDFNQDIALHEISSAHVFDFLKSRLHASVKPWSQSQAVRAKNVLFQAFGLARTLNLIETNPVADLEVLPKISPQDEQRRQKPRFPYNASQLNLIFSSDWYAPNSRKWRGKMREDLGARYWIPLICMWQGLRVTEAAQLQVEDVNTALWQLTIQDSEAECGPARSIKNTASKRVVPIHRTLLEQGFINFVELVQRSYQSGPLFPSALPDKNGVSPKWGRAYEQAFLRFVRDSLRLGNGYGNHSFRHSLEDRIRAANVGNPWPEGLAHAYTGRASTRHEDKGVLRAEGSEKHYGNGYDPDAIRHYIDQISYPEVSLPPRFIDWLDGREFVSHSLLTALHRWQKNS